MGSLSPETEAASFSIEKRGQRTGSKDASDIGSVRMKIIALGLFALLLTPGLVSGLPSPEPVPDPAPEPLIPSGLALLYTPIVCPFFYVGKAVKAAQTAVNAVTG